MNQQKKILIIGTFKKYGAGKISQKIYETLNKEKYCTKQIDINKLTFINLYEVFKATRNQDLIFYQASIYKFSFLRDLLMIFIFKLSKAKKIYIVNSDLTFGNIFLKSKKLSQKLFKDTVITLANLEQFKGKENLVLIKPDITSDEQPIIKHKNKCFVHIGYLDSLKGWDLFNQIVKDNSKFFFYSLGISLKKQPLNTFSNHKILESKNTNEIYQNLRIINQKSYPCFLFVSRNDLFPLVVPEMMSVEVPIFVFKDSVSEKILMRFCPEGSYIPINTLDDAWNIDDNILSSCIENAKKFSNTCNTKNFEKSVKKSIEVSNIS